MRALRIHRDKPGLFLEDRDVGYLGVGQVQIKIMASSINHNTVWSAKHEPVSPFTFPLLHGIDKATVGSDASGVITDIGDWVDGWKIGDEVVVHCLEMPMHSRYQDSLHDPGQKIWGYETSRGGLADEAIVDVTQLLPKPKHLTWAEAASMPLVNSTAYRMLVGDNGSRMKQGDVVLIWGATGGLGSMAVQYVLNGGGIPICVVSSEHGVDLVEGMGAEHWINREAFDFTSARDMKLLQKTIRTCTDGEDPDIVFEHPGKDTFAASVYVAKRGGTIVTCASTTGYQHTYDNRYLWMNVKKIIGSHFANQQEAWEANRMVQLGMIHPTVSKVVRLEDVPDILDEPRVGKVAVLCQADSADSGVSDQNMRDKYLKSINLFKGA